MSRYAVNVLMRDVNLSPASLDGYRADPVAFVAEWQTLTGLPLDDVERPALETRDYATLYRLGAHPYLLWSFTEAVLVPGVARPELVAAFREAAAAVGYPDHRTVPAPGVAGILDTF